MIDEKVLDSLLERFFRIAIRRRVLPVASRYRCTQIRLALEVVVDICIGEAVGSRR